MRQANCRNEWLEGSLERWGEGKRDVCMQFNFKAAGGCFKYSTNVLNKKGKSGGFMGGLALGFLLVASQSKLKYDCHVIETKKPRKRVDL